MAQKISQDADKFFDELLVAGSGFYHLEADDMEDLSLTRGIDYRSSTTKGICLVLGCTFPRKSDYLQGLGRVKRHTDEGCIYEL